MRISFSTFACPQWSLRQVAEAADRQGYRTIEFRCDAQHAHGVEVFASAEERRKAYGLLQGFGIEVCCLATSLQFVVPEVLDEAQARIRLAGDIGAPGLRVFCGPPLAGMTLAEATALVGEHLHYAADMAEAAGVQLWLQTHDTLSRVVDAAAAVHRADHRLVGLCYDPLHSYRAGEPLEESLAALPGLVRHVHFHDGMNRPDKVAIKPLGEGELPISAIFEGLIHVGFNGCLTGEWFGSQYGPDPEEALARYQREMQALAQGHGVQLQ